MPALYLLLRKLAATRTSLVPLLGRLSRLGHPLDLKIIWSCDAN